MIMSDYTIFFDAINQSNADSYRFEEKYVERLLDEKILLIKIKSSRLFFKEKHTKRTVHNIYFDTHQNRFHQEHFDESFERIKCRVRWYSDAHGIKSNSVFEVKGKRGKVGFKLHYPIEPIEFDTIDGVFLEKLQKAIIKIPFPDKSLLYDLIPTLYNQYERYYFESTIRPLRLTVDKNLQFAKLQNNTLRAITNREDIFYIIELKYSAKDVFIQTIDLPFYPSRFSKFLYGTNL